MTEATFESVKGKLEVIAPNLRHSHAAKITIFCNITSYEQNTLISKEKWSHDGPNAERFFWGLTSITLKMNTRCSCLEWGIVLFIMDESHLSQRIKKPGFSWNTPAQVEVQENEFSVNPMQIYNLFWKISGRKRFRKTHRVGAKETERTHATPTF